MKTRREDRGPGDPQNHVCRTVWGQGRHAATQLNCGLSSLPVPVPSSANIKCIPDPLALTAPRTHGNQKRLAGLSLSAVLVKGRGKATRWPHKLAIPRGLFCCPTSLCCLWPIASRKLAGLI